MRSGEGGEGGLGEQALVQEAVVQDSSWRARGKEGVAGGARALGCEAGQGSSWQEPGAGQGGGQGEWGATDS